MIYITKGQTNRILTDAVRDVVVENLELRLDDVVLGVYENISNSHLRMQFILTVEDVEDLEERGYQLSIYKYDTLLEERQELLKTELLQVKDFRSEPIDTINYNKQIKFYD